MIGYLIYQATSEFGCSMCHWSGNFLRVAGAKPHDKGSDLLYKYQDARSQECRIACLSGRFSLPLHIVLKVVQVRDLRLIEGF